jgi:hypothetical protein
MPTCAICSTNGAELVAAAQDDDVVCADSAACWDRLTGGFYLEHPEVLLDGAEDPWTLTAIGGDDDGPDMATVTMGRQRKTVPVRALTPALR